MSAAGWVHVAWGCVAVMVALGLAAPVMRRLDAREARRLAARDRMIREARRRTPLKTGRGQGAGTSSLLPHEQAAFAEIAARVGFPPYRDGQAKDEIRKESA